MTDWLLNNVISWLLAKAVLASLNPLWALLSSIVFTNPDVTALPQVSALVSRSQLVVDAGFVLAVITAGITVMTHQSLQIRYGVGEVLPRLVIGFIASNFATPLCRNLIETANALTKALTGERIGSPDGYSRLLGTITDSLKDPTASFLVVGIGLILVALTAMLAVSAVVRIVVLIVLAGIAPIALACHATPYTDPAARLWWRAFLGTLATVLLQALALYATLDILLNPAMDQAALGLPRDSRTLNLLIVVCLLWIVVKIPGLMRRYVLRGGSQSNVLGMIVRMALVQQLTRAIPGIGRLGRAGRASGAAAAGRGAARAGAGAPSVANTVIPYWRPRGPRPAPAAAAAAGGAGGVGGAPPAPAKIPAGVTPATAMPKTRPAWRGGRPGTPAAAPARPVPAGVTPRTAMPATLPAWRTTAAPPTPGRAAPPQPRPQTARGVNPGSAMPKTRPAWRRP